jgi:hypothetical protein
MTAEDSQSPETADSLSAPPASLWWLRGVLLVVAGMLLGALALGVFCFALGVNLADEGGSNDQQANRPALIVSLVGFAIATLLFWIGFVQTTRASR